LAQVRKKLVIKDGSVGAVSEEKLKQLQMDFDIIPDQRKPLEEGKFLDIFLRRCRKLTLKRFNARVFKPGSMDTQNPMFNPFAAGVGKKF
jgi:hypothetical protein